MDQPINIIGQKLLTGQELAELEPHPIPWAIEGILAEKDLAFISGEGGVGKSYVLIEFAIALARGRPLFKVEILKRPYRVLYLDCEMSDWATETRFSRMLRGEEEVRGKLDNLFVIPGASFNVDNLMMLDELRKVVEDNKIEYVLIDSVIRTTTGDEKDSQTPNRVLTVARHFRNKFNCGFIYIHHWRKFSSEDGMNADKGQMLRGSAGWRDAVDLHMTVEKRTSDEDTIVVTVEKSRHTDSPKKTPLVVTWDHDDPFDDCGAFRMIARRNQDLDPAEQKALEIILSHGVEGIRPHNLMLEMQVSKSTIHRIGKEFKLRNLVVSDQSKGKGNTIWKQPLSHCLTVVSPKTWDIAQAPCPGDVQPVENKEVG